VSLKYLRGEEMSFELQDLKAVLHRIQRIDGGDGFLHEIEKIAGNSRSLIQFEEEIAAFLKAKGKNYYEIAADSMTMKADEIRSGASCEVEGYPIQNIVDRVASLERIDADQNLKTKPTNERESERNES